MEAGTSVKPSNERQDVAAGVRRWAISGVVGVVTVALCLFLPAWRLDWPMGWALVAIYAAWQGSMAVILIPRDPALLAERAARDRAGTRTWDVTLMSVVGLLTVTQYVVAGLDFRNGWTQDAGLAIPPPVQWAALVVTALTYALLVWAMTANAFFSKIVRIQDDRGHAVATTGPYRIVRHPGYVGSVISYISIPLMLGSLWSLLPGLPAAVLMVVRTGLEDRTLRRELPGYEAYAGRVRYRLFPGLW